MGSAMKVRLRDGTGTRHYRYLVEDVDRHGKVRIYFRRKGRPKIVLQETPGTAAFEAEYQRAFHGFSQPRSPIRLPAAKRTTSWLCEQYYASASSNRLPRARARFVGGSSKSFASVTAISHSRRWSHGTLRSCAMKRPPFPTRPITASRCCGSCSHGQARPNTAMPQRTRHAM